MPDLHKGCGSSTTIPVSYMEFPFLLPHSFGYKGVKVPHTFHKKGYRSPHLSMGCTRVTLQEELVQLEILLQPALETTTFPMTPIVQESILRRIKTISKNAEMRQEKYF